MNILLVEDHQQTSSVLERMLSERGHHVAVARDLETGRAHLQAEQFDAIISDIALPDGSGYALMTEARNAGVTALGIAISAYPFPPDVDEPKLTGFHHHLSKPFTAEELNALLQNGAPASTD